MFQLCAPLTAPEESQAGKLEPFWTAEIHQDTAAYLQVGLLGISWQACLQAQDYASQALSIECAKQSSPCLWSIWLVLQSFPGRLNEVYIVDLIDFLLRATHLRRPSLTMY